MKKHFWPGIAVIGLLIAGCGGTKDDGSKDQTSPPSTTNDTPKDTAQKPANDAKTPSADTKTSDTKAGEPKKGAMAPEEIAIAGKAMVESQNCLNCHTLAGEGKGKKPLDHVGDHDAAWHMAHLKDPSSKSPGSKMPSFSTLGDEKLGILSKYLASLK